MTSPHSLGSETGCFGVNLEARCQIKEGDNSPFYLIFLLRGTPGPFVKMQDMNFIYLPLECQAILPFYFL